MLRSFIFFSFFLIYIDFAKASHVAGAEIDYSLISENNSNKTYKISLVFYRFCGTGATEALNEYPINVFGCIPITTLIVNRKETVPVSSCSSFCFQRILYEGLLTVPADCDQVKLSWQLMYRNSSPFYPESQMAYTESNIYPQEDNNNSSVSNFSNFTGCLGNDYLVSVPLSNYITDEDGDNLVFTLVPPKVDANTNLTFQSGYTWNKPCDTEGNMPISITDNILSFTPVLTQGNTVISIQVDEYKNGVLVGRTTKEFNIVLIPCIFPTVNNGNEIGVGIPWCAYQYQELEIPLSNMDPTRYIFTLVQKPSNINVSEFSHPNDDGDLIVNSLKIGFYATWANINDNEFVLMLEDLCSGEQRSYSFSINVTGCLPEQWCGHPCSPTYDGAIPEIMGMDESSETVVKNCSPFFFEVKNATTVILEVEATTNGASSPIYKYTYFNPNGLNWKRDVDSNFPDENTWVVQYNGQIMWNYCNDVPNTINENGYCYYPTTMQMRYGITATNCNGSTSFGYGADGGNTLFYDPSSDANGSSGCISNPRNNFLEITSSSIMSTDCILENFEKCDESRIFNSTSDFTDNYNGSFSSFTSNFTHTQTNFTVNANQIVELNSANNIIIKEGTIVNSGGIFIAKIQECPQFRREEPKSEPNSPSSENYWVNKNHLHSNNFYSIHPNPNSGQFTLVQTQTGYIKRYRVLNGMGQVLLTYTFNHGYETIVDISFLPRGIYVLLIETVDGLKTERVVYQ